MLRQLRGFMEKSIVSETFKELFLEAWEIMRWICLFFILIFALSLLYLTVEGEDKEVMHELDLPSSESVKTEKI